MEMMKEWMGVVVVVVITSGGIRVDVMDFGNREYINE